MPKIRKKVIDEIRRLGMEGYTTTEISEQVGVSRGTARKYRVDAEASLVQKDSGKAGLSLDNDITKVLYDLQGVMGAPSKAAAVERAYRDAVAVMKFKHTLWEEYSAEGEEFMVEGLIKVLMDHIKFVEKDLKMFTDGYEDDQKIIEKLEKAVKEKVYHIR